MQVNKYVSRKLYGVFCVPIKVLSWIPLTGQVSVQTGGTAKRGPKNVFK